MRTLPVNYDLNNAKEDYKLWDKVHAKEVVAHLVMLSRWEPPGKREIERKRALEAKKANAESTEDKLDQLEQLNKASKGKDRWAKKAKGVARMTGLELYFCMKATRFDRKAINKWHKLVTF